MSDWLQQLPPEQQDEWERFVDHFRREAAQAIAGSAAFVSLLPRAGKLDVKFAVELGTAIMLDKPIIAVARAGVPVPRKLEAICEEIVRADLDTEEGQREIAAAIARFRDRL